jgi:hypothetical protein
MTIIKHGNDEPSVNDLENYQLGWSTKNKKMYIRDDTGVPDNPNKKVFEVVKETVIYLPIEWEDI